MTLTVEKLKELETNFEEIAKTIDHEGIIKLLKNQYVLARALRVCETSAKYWADQSPHTRLVASECNYALALTGNLNDEI